MVTRAVHRVTCRRLMCPANELFIFIALLIMSMTFVLSLTKMLVRRSLYVMLSLLISILVCAAVSLFSACFLSYHISAPLCHSWQHRGVVHLFLQADGKVAFEDIPVFGICRPAYHDASLYLLVIVLFRVATNTPYLSVCTLFTLIVVLSTTITFVYMRYSSSYPVCLLSSDCSCRICCNFVVIPCIRIMSPAERTLQRNCASIFTPLFSLFNLLIMLFRVPVNSLGEIVSV